MEPSTNPPICVFFDLRSFFYGLWSVDPSFTINFRVLAAWLVQEALKYEGAPSEGDRWQVRIYAATRTRGNSAFDPILDRLLGGLESEVGFEVIRLRWRPSPRECQTCGTVWEVYEEEAVDTAIVADMVAMAARGEYRVAVLVSGDSDFIPALEVATTFGAKVYVASWGREHGLSRELEEAAAVSVDLRSGVAQFALELPTEEITPELEAVFLRELRSAEEHFGRFRGYVGEGAFLNSWRGAADFPEPGPLRTVVLNRLVRTGRVERYQVTRGGRTHRAIRLAASLAEADPASPPTSARERPPS